eukprot:6173488-Pleurochrysis_carterae.AAC.3
MTFLIHGFLLQRVVNTEARYRIHGTALPTQHASGRPPRSPRRQRRRQRLFRKRCTGAQCSSCVIGVAPPSPSRANKS